MDDEKLIYTDIDIVLCFRLSNIYVCSLWTVPSIYKLYQCALCSYRKILGTQLSSMRPLWSGPAFLFWNRFTLHTLALHNDDMNCINYLKEKMQQN